MTEQMKKYGPVGVVALAAAVRLFRLGRQSLWCDELFSYTVSRQSLHAIWTRAVQDAVHPPLYYFLLHPIASRTDSEWWLRLPSVLFGAACVWLTYRLALELTDRTVALTAAVLATFSAFQLYHSQETRMYAPLTAFGLAALWALWRALTTSRRRYWVGFTAFSTLALYLNYLAAAVAVTAAGVFLTHWRTYRRSLRPFLLSAGLIALLYAPWGVAMMRGGQGINARRRLGSVRYATLASAGAFMDFTVGYFKGLNQFYHERPPLDTIEQLVLEWGLVSAAALVFLGLAGGAGRRPGASEEAEHDAPSEVLKRWYLAHCLLGPFALGFFVATQTHFKQPRYFALGSPIMAVVLAMGIVFLFRRRTPVLWVLTGGLTLAMTTSLLNYEFNWRYWRDDWRSVARFVIDRYEPGDALVFNAGWMDLPFNHYVVRQGRPPFPTSRIPQENDPAPEEVNGPLATVLSRHRRVWLVLCYTGVSDPKGLVQGYLDHHAVFKRQWEFSRVRVRLYECEAKV